MGTQKKPNKTTHKQKKQQQQQTILFSHSRVSEGPSASAFKSKEEPTHKKKYLVSIFSITSFV